MASVSPSLDVMFGGAITFMVALGGVYLERRWADKIRRNQALEERSAIVFSIQAKIVSAYNWSNSVNSAIDECFKEADDSGASELDIGIKVKPLVGYSASTIEFSPDELSVMLATGDRGIAEQLLSFQWTVGTAVALLNEFNVMRRELSQFSADNAVEGEFVDAGTARIAIPISKKHAHDARITALNPVVWELMQSLADNRTKAQVLMRRVETAASSIEGLIVPKVQFHEL